MLRGDFYEAYGENAKRISDKLNLTLTSKDVGKENRVPLAGYPKHIHEDYIKKLRKSHPIILYENGVQKYIIKEEMEM